MKFKRHMSKLNVFLWVSEIRKSVKSGMPIYNFEIPEKSLRRKKKASKKLHAVQASAKRIELLKT